MYGPPDCANATGAATGTAGGGDLAVVTEGGVTEALPVYPCPKSMPWESSTMMAVAVQGAPVNNIIRRWVP